MEQLITTLSELKEGDHFFFAGGKKEHYVSQKGKIESYCPEVNQNTMGHSKAGGEEVYINSAKVILILS